MVSPDQDPSEDHRLNDQAQAGERIRSKADLEFFLFADLASASKAKWRWSYRVSEPTLSFQRSLRRAEYLTNAPGVWFRRLRLGFRMVRLLRDGQRLGLAVPRNVCGPGLSIAHFGGVIINTKSQIGRNCRIHSGTNIGEADGRAPVIGDNVYIGPGAKLVGSIRVGDGAVIGANAVVVKDVPPRVTVGGIPARVISERDSARLIIDGCAIARATHGENGSPLGPRQ